MRRTRESHDAASVAKEDQSIQARFLDGPHETLRVRVEIRRTWGQADRFDASRSQRVTKHVAEPWISIVEEETFSPQASINRIGELATALDHPGRSAYFGITRNSRAVPPTLCTFPRQLSSRRARTHVGLGRSPLSARS